MYVASDPRIGLMWWQKGIDKMFSNKLIKHSITPDTVTRDSIEQN